MSLAKATSGTPARRAPVALVTVLLALIAFSFAAIPAAAHGSANHGTIKVHDNMTADPPRRNEPHVSCDFWVEGFGVSDDSGTLVFYSWPPTGNKEVVHEAEWTGEASDKRGRFDFLAGPFNFTEGHYRVEAFMDSGHPGNEDHFSKAKMFWVEPCPMPEEELACPPSLVAAVTDDGDIRVSWTDAEGSDATNVYRAVDDGDFELIATVDSGVEEYLDEDVEMGVTYSYTVTGLFGNRESENCAIVEVATIPNFPTTASLVGAAILGTVGYAFVSRRKR